jgi:hypothetical protein
MNLVIEAMVGSTDIYVPIRVLAPADPKLAHGNVCPEMDRHFRIMIGYGIPKQTLMSNGN